MARNAFQVLSSAKSWFKVQEGRMKKVKEGQRKRGESQRVVSGLPFVFCRLFLI